MNRAESLKYFPGHWLWRRLLKLTRLLTGLRLPSSEPEGRVHKARIHTFLRKSFWAEFHWFWEDIWIVENGPDV